VLNDIFNLVLYIVYKWEFVTFLEPNEDTSRIEEATRRRLLVLLPRRLLAGGGAVEGVFAPGARFGGEGAADVALAKPA